MTSRSEAENGNGRSSTPFTTLKIAVFAPIPSASVSTATAVKPGFFNSWRNANLRSFITQRLNGIDFRSPPRRQPAGADQRAQDAQRHSAEGQRIERTDASELMAEGSRRAERQRQA